jgi:hypothetical protein
MMDEPFLLDISYRRFFRKCRTGVKSPKSATRDGPSVEFEVSARVSVPELDVPNGSNGCAK